METFFLGTRVLAEPALDHGVRLSVHRRDARTMLLPTGGPLLPGALDPLQLREEIWSLVRDTVPAAQRDELARRLRPTLDVATERTLTTMQTGHYRRFIDLDALRRHGLGYRYGTPVSADGGAGRTGVWGVWTSYRGMGS